MTNFKDLLQVSLNIKTQLLFEPGVKDNEMCI